MCDLTPSDGDNSDAHGSRAGSRIRDSHKKANTKMLTKALLLALACALGGTFRFAGPCGTILERMRYAGYLVRDCSYQDPFVYWRIEHMMTWRGARAACQAVSANEQHTSVAYFLQVPGGDLASVHSFDEKHALNALSINNYVADDNGTSAAVWIGLRSQGKSWHWSDATAYDYKDWLSSYETLSTLDKAFCGQVRVFKSLNVMIRCKADRFNGRRKRTSEHWLEVRQLSHSHEGTLQATTCRHLPMNALLLTMLTIHYSLMHKSVILYK